MGTIYKRGNTYWIQYYRNGRPYRESTQSNKEVDAKRLLNLRQGEIAKGKLPGIYFDRISFNELYEDYLRDYKQMGKKDFYCLKHRLDKHLKPTFEFMRIINITTPVIQTHIDKRLNEGAANGTINRELASLKAMLNLGARQTPPKVDRNNIPYIPLLRESDPRSGFFEHGDFLAWRDKLPDYLKGLVTFAYKTGWRKDEIASLDWNHVDLKQGIAWIDSGKTKNDKGKVVFLDDELREVISRQWERRKRAGVLVLYVFPNKSNSGKIRNPYRQIHKANKELGIGNKILHDFRRTAVRNMVRAGIPEGVVMMVSGHKTRSVFERYNIVDEKDLMEAARKQEAYLKTQTTTISSTVGKIRQLRP